jgi:hypothetical protein
MNGERRKELSVLRWTPELAQKFWNRLAGTEFQKRTAFARFAAPYLVELVKPYLRPDARVLDYGSGYNLYLIEELLRQGYRAGFFEPSVPSDEQHADLARHEHFLGGVSEIAGPQFDVVFLSEVIEHLFDEEIPVVLDRIHSCLLDEGVLILTTPCNEDLFASSRFCPKCDHLFHPWGHIRSFSPEQLVSLIARYGFECEALLNVDFSAAREPVEELTHLKDRIARLVADMGEICSRETVAPPEVLKLAAHIRSSFSDLTGRFDVRDPRHHQIGFGGTIVAVAKKKVSL